MLDIAMQCYRRGWHVFPCWPGKKNPLIGNGFKGATNDLAQILAWWEKWPTANIGIATGASGLTVLDIDEGISNEAELAVWRAANGLPDTYTVRTGRRPGFGVQMYFEGGTLQSIPWDSGDAHGDIRSATGYVMAEGSLHPSGAFYECLYAAPIVPEPEFVRALKRPELPVVEPGAKMKKIPEGGGRHDALARVAGSFRAMGFDADGIYEQLVAANQTMMAVPVDDADLREMAEGFERRYPAGSIAPEVVIGKPKELKEPVDWRTRYTTAEQFRDVLPPSFLIRDFLEDGSITAIGAPVAQRKSIVVANIIHALLTGEPLFGHFEVVKRPDRILYLCPEMGLVDIANRFKKLGLESYVGESLFIRSMDDPKLPLAELDEELPGSLVILDTITRFVAGNQNDAGDMSVFADVNYAMKRRGATLLLLHHAIKGTAGVMTLDNALRGSTELAAFVTCVWSTQLQNPDEPHTTPSNLKCVKQRGFASEPFQVSCDEQFRMTMLGTMGEIKSQKQVSSEVALAEILKRSPDMGLHKLRDALKAAGHRRGVKWIAAAKVAASGTGVTLTG